MNKGYAGIALMGTSQGVHRQCEPLFDTTRRPPTGRNALVLVDWQRLP